MDEDCCATPMTHDSEALEGAEVSLRSTRASRWLKDETRTLVQAKRLYEQEVAEASCRGQIINKEQKWKRISKKCEDAGVIRDASQCRKRWQNIVRDYKRVKDWQGRSSSRQSYWLMSVEEKRENKLVVPPVFDKDVYEELDHFLANRPGIPPPAVFDSERFTSFKRQQIDQSSYLQAPELCSTMLHEVPSGGGGVAGEELGSLGKRKRAKAGGGDDGLDRLEAMLEKNTKLVMEMQERASEKHESHLEAMVMAIREMTSSLNKMIDKL